MMNWIMEMFIKVESTTILCNANLIDIQSKGSASAVDKLDINMSNKYHVLSSL